MLLALANCLTGEKPCRGESIAIVAQQTRMGRFSVADLRSYYVDLVHGGSDGKMDAAWMREMTIGHTLG